MDIRGYLLILNAVVVITTLVAYTIFGENLNMVGETDEEQARNEKNLTGWFLVSSVIGVLALPVMVAREIWQWKRDKLSRFEWDNVGRYGLAIVFGTCLNTCLLVATSCSATKPVTTERIVHKVDTLYKTNVRADTFRILDSVFVNQYIKGDTVYNEKTAYKWRDRIQVHVDTVWRVAQTADTVRKSTACNINEKITAVEKGRTVLVKMLWGALLMIGVVIGVFAILGARKR